MRWLRSIKKSPEGLTHSSPLPSPSQKDTPSFSLFRDCRSLPFDIFLDVLLDNRLDRLTISGEPTKEDLLAAWRGIYSEYATLTSTSESEQTFKLIKRINVLRFQIERAEAVIAVLNETHSPKLVEYLQRFDINLPFDVTDHEGYQRDLVIASNMVKRWYHDLKIMEQELEPGTKSGKKMDRGYFDDLLFQLSKFAGYAIRAKDITVAEYATAFRAYVEQVNKLNAQSLSHGRTS